MRASITVSHTEPGSANAMRTVSVVSTTPGHTDGSISLLIRHATRPPLLLAGDSPTAPNCWHAARFRA